MAKIRSWGKVIEECAICHMKMREAELHRHLLSCHRIDPLTGHDVKVEMDIVCSCDICGRVMTTYAKKMRHMKTVHRETEAGKEFKCFVCNSPFAKHSYFIKHLHEIHGHAKFEGSEECPVCHRHFLAANLETHIYTKHTKEKNESKKKCTKCEKMILVDEFDRHMARKHRIGGFKCDICDERFGKKNGLTMHSNQVHPDVPFKGSTKCRQCGIYMTRSSVTYHMRNVHGTGWCIIS